MSVNELVEQWLFEYACRHCLYAVLSGNNICRKCANSLRFANSKGLTKTWRQTGQLWLSRQDRLDSSGFIRRNRRVRYADSL